MESCRQARRLIRVISTEEHAAAVGLAAAVSPLAATGDAQAAGGGLGTGGDDKRCAACRLHPCPKVAPSPPTPHPHSHALVS